MYSTVSDFPFGIEFVCDVLGLAKNRYKAGDGHSFYTDCPFCGRKRKMNINLEKNTFNCPACSEGGGMLSLYAKCREVDNKSAAKELFRAFDGSDEDFKARVRSRREEVKKLPKRIDAAPLAERDRAYSALLNQLALTDGHYNDLIRRGLSPEAIRFLGYRSVPQHQLTELAGRIVGQGIDVSAIPGFYTKNGVSRFVWRKSGFFCPVRTLHGQISGLQLRYDNLPDDATELQKEKYRKYVWLTSSEKDGGVSIGGCENIHHAGFYKGRDLTRVCLTEGVLKADIASHISGLPFLGLTGVSNTGQLADALEELKTVGVQEVIECMDMDYQSNPNVLKACRKIHRIVEASGMKITVLTWPAEFKGVDDLLLYKRQRGLI